MPFRKNPGMQLRAAYSTFRRRIQAHCAPYGITSDQLVILSVLAEEDGINQQALADRTCSDAATITAMLRLLERSGLIRRAAHDGDGRAKRIFLTEHGRSKQSEVYESHKGLIRSLTTGFSREERRIVNCWLLHVIDTMSTERP
ncbi:MAG TPA: MarR family transcriptional regulator [Bryobacteraceae bacterium]|nr:MarR family transcriptional regulator [Bryobacteraceae bacterium]